MYRLLDVNMTDKVLDATCGSGAFLVKSMCNMIKESGGVNTDEAKQIKSCQLFGIEFDREIFALACANMLIHKDGKTNLEQLDTRSDEAIKWIKSKGITKVLMNPPYERKYGCMKIVQNVLDSVPSGTQCAFILPDKKLEKDYADKKYGNKLDIIQIGTRNMYNYELLKEVGKLKTPVILKRGLSATYNEWLLAAEYIKNEGNNNIILCERGIRGFDPTTRNILDIAAVPYIKKNTSYPIIVDPSHATGTRYMIRPLSIASIAAGADGIMVEAHIRPEKSLSDARQTINISTLKDIISDINKYQNI